MKQKIAKVEIYINCHTTVRYPHPYQYELDHLEYTATQLEPRPPQEAGTLEDTPCTFINTVDQLTGLLDTLRRETAIAVDLEVCLYA